MTKEIYINVWLVKQKCISLHSKTIQKYFKSVPYSFSVAKINKRNEICK